jgi:hypothetical protein
MPITLTSADALKLVTSASADIDVTASWSDLTPSVGRNDSTDTQIAAAATTTIVAAPPAGATRSVHSITIRNKHASTSNDVTVSKVGTLTATVYKTTLLAGEAVEWTGEGWVKYDTVGARKTTTSTTVASQVQVPAGQAWAIDLLLAATGEALVKLADNLANAHEWIEGTTSYLKAVTTNAAERLAVGVRLTTTDGVASGIARVVGGKVYSNVAASTAITGTTETETLFDAQISLPADTLKAGTVVRVRAQGIHTATTGSEDHSMILKIGSVAVTTMAAIDPANSDVFYFDAVIVCRTAGASGTIVATGAQLAQAASGVGTAKPFLLASTTIDTTGANIVGVAIDRQGTATDSDSARLDILFVEVIG